MFTISLKNLTYGIALSLMIALPSNLAMAQDSAANKALVLKAFDELFIKGDVTALERYWSEKYIQHNPQAPNGREALAAFVPMFATSKFSIARVIADGDIVAIHYNAILEDNSVMGAGPKGIAVVDIFRIENGKIVEHWDVIQPVPEKSANDNTMF